MNKYYVYEYLREDGSPYYIGKGSGFRAYCKRPYRPKDKSRIKIIKDNLTEEEAFNLEINLIEQYGRQDLGTGILKNKTDGGEGCSLSDETKQKLSIAGKGKIPWNKGLNSELDKRVKKNAESRSKVKYSEETKQAFRKPKSEQGKANMSLGQKGKKYPKVPCKHCGLLYPSNSMASHLRKHKGDQ
jgi:hypothetical protein